MTFAENTARRQGTAQLRLLAHYPVTFYFLIAYSFAWLVWVPVAFSQDGAHLLSFHSPIGASASVVIASFVGPCLSAFIMTSVTEGREGIRQLLRRCVLWRVGFGWYLFTLIIIPLILVLGVTVLPGATESFKGLASMAAFPWLSQIFYVFLHGPLGEEPGWRGFALPRLQRMHGPLVASLILGPLWALWHLPFFWVPAWNFPPTLANIVLFVVASVPVTIMMTWVFNNTKGSVFMAILGHWSFDFAFVILNVLFTAHIVTDYGSTLPVLIGFGMLALMAIAVTRGQLGYESLGEPIVES